MVHRRIKPIIISTVAVIIALAVLCVSCAVFRANNTESSEFAPESGFSESPSENSDSFGAVSDDTPLSRPDISEPEQADPDEWKLILINRDNPVPEGYEPTLVEIERGYMVDHRICDDLKAMLADARAEGLIPRINSAYRPADDQLRVMAEYVDKYIKQGYTREEAEEEARKWVAPPGLSEHETGLAVDISTANWKKQSGWTVWKWLEKNCWKYGFILRYTKRCSEYTGASVEQWHFRYVGTEYAQEITDSGLCFEEWLEARSEAQDIIINGEN